jgi:hypothetical protein
MRTMILCIALLLAGAASAVAAPPKAFHFFHSPSGNIDCLVTKDFARCDIRQHTFRGPARPKRCDLEWGSVLEIGKSDRRGGFGCVGDTVRDPSARALAYGKTIRAGGMHCTSRTDGVRCANSRGHGFLLGRTKYRLF